jgi:hypothetical protein
MKKYTLNAGLGLLLLGASLVVSAQVPITQQEVRGVLQPSQGKAGLIRVGGMDYRLHDAAQVIDRNARLVPAAQLRPGVPVLLVLSAGRVTHIVVNPANGNPLDQPIR